LRARLNEIKPDPVDQPERTAHYDQHHCSDEAKWRLGEDTTISIVLINSE